MASNPLPVRVPDPRTQRILGLAMAAGVVLFAGVAIVLALGRGTPPSPPSAPVWALCGAGLAALGAGWMIPVDGARRRLVSLALRETAGLIGSLLTLWTGSATWAVALGLLSVASLLAGVATVPDESPRPGAPRLG